MQSFFVKIWYSKKTLHEEVVRDCLCFRMVLMIVAYILERFLVIFAYVLEILRIFAAQTRRNYKDYYVRKRTYNTTETME